MATEYKFDLPPRADQLEAIGMVAVEWSYLESVIDGAIGTLAAIVDDAAMEAITTHIAFNTRLNMLTTLFHLRCDAQPEIAPQAAAFETIRRAIDVFAVKRNGIVHARWVRGLQGSPLTYVVQARGRLKRTRKGMPTAEILGIAQQIAEQSNKLRSFFDLLEDDLFGDDVLLEPR
jgi:hypothetical protein